MAHVNCYGPCFLVQCIYRRGGNYTGSSNSINKCVCVIMDILKEIVLAFECNICTIIVHLLDFVGLKIAVRSNIGFLAFRILQMDILGKARYFLIHSMHIMLAEVCLK